MPAGLQNALLKCPPGPTGGTSIANQNYTIAAASAASAVTIVLPDGIPFSGGYVTWVCTVDCHVRCAALTTTGSATTSDFFLPAGVIVDWWHDDKLDTHFSVIRAASAVADGALKRYRSAR